jgi:adenylate cyclase
LRSEASGDIESALELEMLRSERTRLALLLALVGVAFLYTLLLVLLAPEQLARSVGGAATASEFWRIPGCFALLLAHLAIVRRWVSGRIERGDPIPAPARWGLGVIEVSFPTLLIALFPSEPAWRLASPVILLYPVFIASSGLSLVARLPVALGVVAAVEYVVLARVLLADVDPTGLPAWATAPNPFFSRGVALVLGGCVSGFVAGQVRRRFLEVFRATEERARIARTFGQHVSPQVVEKLLAQGARPESEMRFVCVMFLDIRGFTTLSEGRDPAEVVALLNRLFSFMIEITNAERGIINKFLGDGFMAVYGAPVSDGGECRSAVRAAKRILDALDEENARSGTTVRVGIGLHAGEAITGEVGSAERKEYTVIGDVVNVASRVEGLNKELGSRALITEAVRDALDPAERGLPDRGAVPVKGRAEPVRVSLLA